MSKHLKNQYHGSMAVLYIVCRFGWTLYLKHWERFAELSSEYTKEFGMAALAAVNATQAMPNVSQRRSYTKMQGNELDAAMRPALLYWKRLRRYITKAVKGATQKAAIAGAGGAHFAKARKGNYAEITELLTAGQVYLLENAELLLDKGKMAAGFISTYNNMKVTYDSAYLAYGGVKGNAREGTGSKVIANNALYEALQMMFGDAQTVFEDEKATLKQFSYAAVRRMITRDLSGIHFIILHAVTKKPLTKALILTDECDEAVPVDKRGALKLLMKVGTHSVSVMVPGFADYTGVVKADAGVKHLVRIEMKVLDEVLQPVLARGKGL